MRVIATLVAILLFVPSVTYASDERHAFQFHGASRSDAIALVGAEFHRKLLADGSVGGAKDIERMFPPLTFPEALEVLKSFGLDYTVYGEGSDAVYVFSNADSMSRSRAGVYDRSVNFIAVDDHLLQFLEKSLPAGTQVLASTTNRRVIITGTPEALGRAQVLLDRIDVSTVGNASDARATRIVDFYIAHDAKPSDLVKELNLTSQDTAEGSVSVDDHAKRIVLAGSRTYVSQVKARLAALDVPPEQGRFDVEILLMTTTTGSQLGFQYGGQGLTNTSTTGITATPGATSTAFTTRYIPINVTINDLVQGGKAKVLAKTQLLASQFQESDLKAGERYPFPVPDPITQLVTYQFEDVGVIVNVTPNFSDDTVAMKLHLEESELTGTVNGSYPIVSQNVYDGPSIRLKYGETLVIAGLLKDTDSSTVQRFAPLDKIPLIGAFFKYKSTSTEKDELVFLFTPHRDSTNEQNLTADAAAAIAPAGKVRP